MFKDTMPIEPEEEMLISTEEKILKLSDTLAEEIILDSIRDQLSDEVDPLVDRINYVSLFKEKYSSITPDDNYYDDEYLKESLARVATTISEKIIEKYGVLLGEDLDFRTPLEYFEDMETLYEFLFIRHFENLSNYFKNKLMKDKESFLKVYRDIMSDEKHSKDLFVVQSKKKFKNYDDVIIMHFIGEIINDIKDSVHSAYDMFTEIVNLDLYEEYNNKMSELLINYGNRVVIDNDTEAAKLYLKPLDDKFVFSELRNSVLLFYLDGCELND